MTPREAALAAGKASAKPPMKHADSPFGPLGAAVRRAVGRPSVQQARNRVSYGTERVARRASYATRHVVGDAIERALLFHAWEH